MAKAAFKEKITFFSQQEIGLKCKEGIAKCFIWSVSLFGAENRELREVY
jgi:hypothetical protein